jgi:hypothetical protein
VRANRVLTRPRGWALLAAGVVAVGVPLAGGTLVAGGTLGGLLQPLPTLTVKKVVTGPVPPGTTFTVSVQCVGADPAAAGSASTTATTAPVHAASNPVPVVITFDAQGNPTTPGSNVLSVVIPSTCTVTEEPPNGGAQSVSYGCVHSSGVVCEPNQQTVQYPGDDTSGETATVTVTNVFPPPPPPPVVVSPQFTG